MRLWTYTIAHTFRRIGDNFECVHLSTVLMSNVNILDGDYGELLGS